MKTTQTPWNYDKVVDTGGPEFVLRTYLEQTDVRAWLQYISQQLTIKRACDVGAGYGRLSVVLTEFAACVVSFEREPHFVADAHRLLPQIDFRHTPSLAELPAESSSFDVVMTFTVLQHLDNSELRAAIAEIKRILACPGYLLICEETDERLRYEADGETTIGRSVEEYRRLLAPLTLIATLPRRIEPTYHRSDVGTYMLFQRV